MIKWIMIGYLFLAGCATTGKYEAKLANWKGASEQALVAEWGQPTELISSGDMSIYEYLKEDSKFATPLYIGREIRYVDEYRIWCKTTFVVEKKLVTSWRWEGNGCRTSD